MTSHAYRSLANDYAIADQALNNSEGHGEYPFSQQIKDELKSAIRGLLFDNKVLSVAPDGTGGLFVLEGNANLYRWSVNNPGNGYVLIDSNVQAIAVGTEGLFVLEASGNLYRWSLNNPGNGLSLSAYFAGQPAPSLLPGGT